MPRKSSVMSFQVVRVLALAGAATLVLRADSFTPTAPMHMARAGHQATLLTDGRVLVTGGSDDSGTAIGRAEIFSPVTRTWVDTGPNVIPRLEHAAVLLPDGRVLVVGGALTSSSCEPIGAAEIYDPETARWSLTENLPLGVGRGPIAVRLADGRVLVSGGGTPCGKVSTSTIVFDAVSNTWTLVSPMNVPRQFHTAVLSADGRVLVTGGAPDIRAVDAETYDPASGSWTIVQKPTVVQGTSCDGYLPSFAALLEGGAALAAHATAPECSSLTILAGARFLVAGGTASSGRRVESAETFDPISEHRTLTGPLATARAGHTATRLVNGSVLLAGGEDGTGRTASSEIYIPEIPYAASPLGLLRGGVVRGREFFYGGLLAAALNSKDHLLISYTHGRPSTRILEWNRLEMGRPLPPLREIGAGFEEFHSVRLDKDDNIWAVAPAANEVVRFNANGEVLLRFGAPPPADADAGAGSPPPPLERPYLDHPLDVEVDGRGNIFVVDGERNPRIAKFDRRGRFVASAGLRGSRPGEMRSPHSVAIDATGNVYVADGGNARIQVFSNALALLTLYDTVGAPWALCMTKGAHQYLFSASNPDRTDNSNGDLTGEIFKLELDGTIVGRFGRSDNARGAFRTPHFVDCSRENELILVGISDSLQTITLLPQ